MRITRLQALGLKGHFLFSGPVDLDLSTIPAGVVALCGPNGHGKSTTLEAMFAAYWGEFPSHAAAKNLADCADRKDAYLDVTSEFDGRGTFRARVNLDAIARATDGILERVHPDGRRETLNDGKISTFKAAIAREFPPKELILASAFAAQGKVGSFARLGKKERRDLFAALLGLEQYEARATTARAAAAAVDRRLVELRAAWHALAAAASDQVYAELEGSAQAFQADIVTLERERDDRQGAIDQLARAIAKGRTRAAQYAEAAQAVASIDAKTTQLVERRAWLTRDLEAADVDAHRERAAAKGRRDQAVAFHQRAIDRLRSAADLDQALTATISRLEAERDVRIRDRQERIDNNKAFLLDRAPEIRAAVDQLARIEQQIQDITRTHQQMRAGHAGLEAARTAAAVRVTEATAQLEDRAADARAAQLLAGVPCHGETAFVGCQFLQDATAAQARLEQWPAEATLLQAFESAVADHNAASQVIQDAVHRMATLGHDLTRLEGERVAVKKTADLIEKLNAAEHRRRELQDEQASLRAETEAAIARAHVDRDAEGQAVAAEWATHEEAIGAAEQTLSRELADVDGRASTRRQATQSEIDQIATALEPLAADRAHHVTIWETHADAHVQLLEDEAALTAARSELADRQVRLARLEEQVAVLQRRRADWAKARSRADQLHAAVTALEQDLLEWELLARILGRDGLPTLEIDAAGPGVSALANDLLQACFGTRFMVELVTQEAKADGKGFKEVFELCVYDSERGGEAKDLTELSGGEQVVVDEALKSAIALYVNQRNELPIRTCWRDETAGALDPENALRYMQMLRRIRERGGFHHLFVVLHNPDAAALADVQLVVAHGRIDVRYPPFAAPAAA